MWDDDKEYFYLDKEYYTPAYEDDELMFWDLEGVKDVLFLFSDINKLANFMEFYNSGYIILKISDTFDVITLAKENNFSLVVNPVNNADGSVCIKSTEIRKLSPMWN